MKKYFYLFTFSSLGMAFINSFFRPDQQGDGLLYDYLGETLYLGKGTLWAPHLSEALWSVFSEHPSLGFAFTSIPYYLFGDFSYNGEFFFILMFLVLLIPFYGIWKRIYQNETSYHQHFWFFPILFASMPLVQKIYQKGFLETIFSPILAGSVFFFIVAFDQLEKFDVNGNQKNKFKIRNKGGFGLAFLTAVLLILLGFLVKGPVTLFPLVVPFLYFFWIKRNLKRGIFFSFLAFIIFTGGLGVLSYHQEIRQMLVRYYEIRTGDLDAFHYTFKSFFNAWKTFFLNESSRAWGVVLVLWLLFNILKLKKVKITLEQKKWSAFLFSISLTAYLPLFLSPKFYTYYIMPSLAYLTMAIILWIVPRWDCFLQSPQNKKTKTAFKVICVGVFIYALYFGFNAYSRYKGSTDFQDFQKLKIHLTKTGKGQEILDQKKLLLCPNLRDQTGRNIDYGDPWFWHIYAQKVLGVSLVFTGNDHFVLGVKEDQECSFQLKNYKEVEIGLSRYQLFKKN